MKLSVMASVWDRDQRQGPRNYLLVKPLGKDTRCNPPVNLVQGIATSWHNSWYCYPHRPPAGMTVPCPNIINEIGEFCWISQIGGMSEPLEYLIIQQWFLKYRSDKSQLQVIRQWRINTIICKRMEIILNRQSRGGNNKQNHFKIFYIKTYFVFCDSVSPHFCRTHGVSYSKGTGPQ